MRLFIAIDLEPAIKSEIGSFIRQLKPLGGNIRWVKTEGMHITLKFLGEVDESRVESIKRAMDRTVAGFRRFRIELKGTGRFPERSERPRVLWIGVEGGQEISRLQQVLEDELLKEGFQKETRAFIPHLTLGRVKGFSAIRTVLKKIEENEDRPFGQMVVRKVVLFRSILKPDGAEYKQLYEAELK